MFYDARMGQRQTVGEHLREWRQRRRMSQLDLALEAGISTRHLSFVETGRALPSRDMLLHLAKQLDVPVRERNVLLVAAGYAPIFPESLFTGSSARGGACRHRPRAGSTEAVPRFRSRPALVHRRQQ